jgi:hypothetical protein
MCCAVRICLQTIPNVYLWLISKDQYTIALFFRQGKVFYLCLSTKTYSWPHIVTLTNGCLMLTAHTHLALRLTINAYDYLPLFPYTSSRRGDRCLLFLSVANQKVSPNPLPYLQNTPRQFLCSHDGSSWYWNNSPATHVRDRITIQIYSVSGSLRWETVNLSGKSWPYWNTTLNHKTITSTGHLIYSSTVRDTGGLLKHNITFLLLALGQLKKRITS